VWKTYDIRGIYPEEINSGTVTRIAATFANNWSLKYVAIGYDARTSGSVLATQLSAPFINNGICTVLLPNCGTEEIYYECIKNKFDLGIMVTASHNPKEYNGLKFILANGFPFTEPMLQKLKECYNKPMPASTEKIKDAWQFTKNDRVDYANYLRKLTGFREPKHKVVVNCGNGTAGTLLKDFGFILVNEKPDGSFPNGVPNPMLPSMREETSKLVTVHKADFGVAFDGDFDRCFFFDEQGTFIDGYYSGGLLMKQFILDSAVKINLAYDSRLYWNTLSIIKEHNCRPILSKTGHVFMKETMRKYDCIFGFENSGHHYFKEFGYCDSGILPLLLMDRINKPLSELIAPMKNKFPCSDEINFTLQKSWNPFKRDILSRIFKHYSKKALHVSKFDGLSMDFEHWRFSLRKSNTEPLVRLNVETYKSRDLLAEKISEVSNLIES
jgi:phosphomannomutase